MTRLTAKELMAIWKTDKSVGWHLYELCWLVTSNAESILDKTVTGKRMKGLLPRIQDFPPTYDQQVPAGTKCQVATRKKATWRVCWKDNEVFLCEDWYLYLKDFVFMTFLEIVYLKPKEQIPANVYSQVESDATFIRAQDAARRLINPPIPNRKAEVGFVAIDVINIKFELV